MNHNSSRSHTIFRVQVQSRCFNTASRVEEIIDSHLVNPRLPPIKAVRTLLILREARRSAFTTSTVPPQLQKGIHWERTPKKDAKRASTSIRVCSFSRRSFPSKVKEKRTSIIYWDWIACSDVHIPYRNSAITKILRSSLGGNSRTLIVLCLNPSSSQFEQSMSTLRFGVSAKKITNNIHANISVSNPVNETMKALLNDFEAKIHVLDLFHSFDLVDSGSRTWYS